MGETKLIVSLLYFSFHPGRVRLLFLLLRLCI